MTAVPRVAPASFAATRVVREMGYARLPAHRIATALVAGDECAVCGSPWPVLDVPVPTAYTDESIRRARPPQPICDLCVERQDPELFGRLLAQRRFYRGT